MLVTGRQLLHQLDGYNTEVDTEALPARQVLRTPVRERFLEEELEWAGNAHDRYDIDVNANHQMVTHLTAQARITLHSLTCFFFAHNMHVYSTFCA